ncbi:MAG: methyltransferase domain-containing protein [Thermoflexales bacterium]
MTFFTSRAADGEEWFADDAPRFERSVREMQLPHGALVLDLGCGTGRAMPMLQAAVGAAGLVIGLDATAAMLLEATRRGRRPVVLGDVLCLPFADRCADAIFAAGLLPHLEEPIAALAEMARVSKLGAMLALFHPIGRATLAARHGRALSDEDVLAPKRLADLLERTGWHLRFLDDAAERYLALAQRQA